MITKKTVLIIGAGASKPYGYPTGLELKYAILTYLESAESREQLLNIFGFENIFVAEFLEAFRLSGRNSIDQFLEFRPEYMEIGKAVITMVLKEHEDLKSLFNSEDWYSILYNNALLSPFESFHENQLSVITFNYDRSLETFLFTALKNSFNKTDEEIYTKLKQIPILHIHGQMGFLPWENRETSRPYENTTDAESIKESSSKIKIIHEAEIETDQTLKDACKLLSEAGRVIFLGFGYNETNLKRLKIDELALNRENIFGTSVGLTKLECEAIENMTDGKLNLGIDKIWTTKRKIVDFLKEYVIFD